MIYDDATNTIVGNLGWVDRGSLWLLDLTGGTETQIAIDDAKYLSLRSGLNGLFRLVHHQSSELAVSLRHSAEPRIELASIRFIDRGWHFSGDASLWQLVDASVIIQTIAGPKLIWIDAYNERVAELDLSWFNNTNYDLGYQGLVDCLSLPAAGLVVVAVQRSSELVTVDPNLNRRVGAIMLAGRGGNPALNRRSGTDFLASDYDSLCFVNAQTGAVRCSPPLQPPPASNTQQFIGDYDPDEANCIVARPFSGDVVLVDLKTFTVCDRAHVAGQPLAVCMTSKSTFVTRDWKTGKVEVGQFRH